MSKIVEREVALSEKWPLDFKDAAAPRLFIVMFFFSIFVTNIKSRIILV